MGDHISPQNSPVGSLWGGSFRKLIGAFTNPFSLSDPATNSGSLNGSNYTSAKNSEIRPANAADDGADRESPEGSVRRDFPNQKLSLDSFLHKSLGQESRTNVSDSSHMHVLQGRAVVTLKKKLTLRQSRDPAPMELPSLPTAANLQEKDIVKPFETDSLHGENLTPALKRSASRTLDEVDFGSDLEITGEFQITPNPSNPRPTTDGLVSFASPPRAVPPSNSVSFASAATEKPESRMGVSPNKVPEKKAPRKIRVIELSRKRRILAPSSDSEEDTVPELVKTNPLGNPGGLGSLRVHPESKKVKNVDLNAQDKPKRIISASKKAPSSLDFSRDIPHVEYVKPGSAALHKYELEFVKMFEVEGFRVPQIEGLRAEIDEWMKMAFEGAELDEAVKARCVVEAKFAIKAHPDVFGVLNDRPLKNLPDHRDYGHDDTALGPDDGLISVTKEKAETSSLPASNLSKKHPKEIRAVDGICLPPLKIQDTIRSPASLNPESTNINGNATVYEGVSSLPNLTSILEKGSSLIRSHVEKTASVAEATKLPPPPTSRAKPLEIELGTPIYDDSIANSPTDAHLGRSKKMLRNARRRARTALGLERKQRKAGQINLTIYPSGISKTGVDSEETLEKLTKPTIAEPSSINSLVEEIENAIREPQYSNFKNGPRKLPFIAEKTSEQSLNPPILPISESPRQDAFTHSSSHQRASCAFNVSDYDNDQMDVVSISLGSPTRDSAEDLRFEGNSSTQIPRTVQNIQATQISHLLLNDYLSHLDTENSVVIPNSSQSVNASQRPNPLTSQIAVNSSQESHVHSTISSLNQTNRTDFQLQTLFQYLQSVDRLKSLISFDHFDEDKNNQPEVKRFSAILEGRYL